MDEKEIIELYWKRDQEAVTRTQQQYGILCRSVARRILSDERDVEECLSDVYMKLWTAIPPERPRSLQAYLLRVVRNTAVDRAVYNSAQMRKSALTQSFDELEPCLFGKEGSPERYWEAQELREFINGFLRELKKESRVIFVRRYWYGETIREICQGLHLSEATVKSSLYHTRRRLEKRMEQEGVSR